nr:hypothetical protein [Cytophagales bacterium]
MLKSVGHKVLVYFVGKAITALISLMIIPLFIRWFGSENYGKYILTYVTFLIFISGSIGWINQSIIKFHGDFANRDQFYKKAHNISYIFSLLSVIPLLLTVSFSLSTSSSFLVYALLGVAYVFACRYTSLLIERQSEIRPLEYTLAEIIRLLSFLIATYFFRLVPYLQSIEVIFSGLLVSYFLSYLYLKKSLRINDFKVNIKVDFQLVKKFFFFGIPLSVWMVFSPGTNGVDKYILNYFVGPAVLAYYAAVYDVIFKVFIQVVNPINSVFQPLLMNIHSEGDGHLFTRALKRALLYLFIVCTPLLCAVYFFQDYILGDYLGISDAHALGILKKLILPIALSAVIWQIAIILQKRLEAKEQTLQLTIYIIIVVLINSIFSIWLIPKYDFSVLGYINLGGSLM